mmetsp:Transcript_65765/g.189251  ORF Transcript_65765/g.189251 Transcript_65765/m.189251 type:complete len:268 (+) Transcript_65765:72-875(+)|eukprot:CAMPEP_0177178530 /NCGR_PEP_ID=MMETSP0367-20130122/14376_1 /TAXON_ID=447022 ORGANISM="Scrippsiella hangoei-like, Strain SHHI-4" /NCGR_SAMPLE_ID=MMETSP0367 /ASSEMBLY_ACC=CAM_ASM_000362 /LENGTH=267 /DNA_ID=CAMNT_0018625191 /DNA_START=71 /DNA_END=874 /DNA_ORIENTATION=+
MVRRCFAAFVAYWCAVVPRHAAASAAKLYHFPLFSSSRVVQLVLELGIRDVEIVSLEYGEIKTEPYLSINPHGTVPAYTEALADGTTLILLESAAIATYLCEKYDTAHRLLPENPTQRARFYQFAHYAPATLYTRAGGLYVHAWEFRLGTAGEGRQSKAAIEASKTWLDSHFVPFLTRELEDRQFLLGEWLTAADIVMGWEIMLLGQVGFFQEYPVLQAYHDRLAAQSSWKRTYPREVHTLCIWPHTDGRCKELHHGLNEVPLNVEL